MARAQAEAVLEDTPAQTRSPARAKLAEAIATVAAIEAELAETGAALSQAEADRSTAGSTLLEAEQALERAKPRPNSFAREREPYSFRSQEEVDAYQAELNAPPVPIEDARAAVATATDARDSAARAVQFHEGHLRQLTDRLQRKRFEVDEALRLAVHFDPALAALAAEAKSLATRAAAAARAFEVATGGAVIRPDSPFYGCTSSTDFRTDPEGWRTLRLWRGAMEQLKTDPDARLPA